PGALRLRERVQEPGRELPAGGLLPLAEGGPQRARFGGYLRALVEARRRPARARERRPRAPELGRGGGRGGDLRIRDLSRGRRRAVRSRELGQGDDLY